jgi:hypothetical protein
MVTESIPAAAREQGRKIEVVIQTPAGDEHRFEVHATTGSTRRPGRPWPKEA